MQTHLLANDGIDQAFEDRRETGRSEAPVTHRQGREARISGSYRAEGGEVPIQAQHPGELLADPGDGLLILGLGRFRLPEVDPGHPVSAIAGLSASRPPIAPDPVDSCLPAYGKQWLDDSNC